MKQAKKGLHTYLSKKLAYYSICFLGSMPLIISAQTGAVSKTLKDVYKDAFLIGAAVNPSITSGRDQASQDLVIKQFNSITVENAMKAAPINPQSGVYNYGPADDYVAFGDDNRVRCRCTSFKQGRANSWLGSKRR